MVFFRHYPFSDASRKIAAKLCPRWLGPFRFLYFLTPVTARLDDLNSGEVVTRAHLSEMKLAVGN
jgi:hypothetical protein